MRRILLGLVGSLLTACPGTGLGTGGEGAVCSSHADCESSLVCASDRCGSPYGKQWRLTVLRARVSAHAPNGGEWDMDGSGPDPFVVVRVDDRELARTATRTDTRDPTWSEAVTFTLTDATAVQIGLYDEDLLVPEGIAATPNGAVSALELRQGDVMAYAVTGPVPDGGSTNDETSSITFHWELAQ